MFPKPGKIGAGARCTCSSKKLEIYRREAKVQELVIRFVKGSQRRVENRWSRHNMFLSLLQLFIARQGSVWETKDWRRP